MLFLHTLIQASLVKQKLLISSLLIKNIHREINGRVSPLYIYSLTQVCSSGTFVLLKMGRKAIMHCRDFCCLAFFFSSVDNGNFSVVKTYSIFYIVFSSSGSTLWHFKGLFHHLLLRKTLRF